jgi:glycosyltransferase involved in cell wall biosynthesis
MEKPLITTDVTGCRDVVDDGVNGFLCKVKSGPDLAEKMIQMMNLSIAEREIMGKKGREKMIRKFDKKLVIQMYLQAINETINAK